MSVHFANDPGINLSFARLLLDSGCNVLIADLALRPEAQVIVDKHTPQTTSSRAVFQQTDVTDWVQLERMFEVAEREFGEIDIVCPGAGVYEPVFPLLISFAYIPMLRNIDSTGAISGVLLGQPRVAIRPQAADTP